MKQQIPIGTKCKVIASVRNDRHRFDIGDEVHLIEYSKHDSNSVYCNNINGKTSYCNLEELQPINLIYSSPLVSLFSNLINK